MSPRRDDDDPLSWGGDDDPTLEPGDRPVSEAASVPAAAPAPPEPLPKGYTALGRGSETVETDAAPATAGSATLITLGVLGGVYLLFAIGWLVAGFRLQPVADGLVSPSGGSAPPLWAGGNVVALVLAVAAPAIWFLSVLLLSRKSKPWVRITLLVVGAILFIPWPFISVGVIGS